MTNAEIREFKSYVRDTLVRKYHLNEVEAARAVRDSYLSKALAMDKDLSTMILLRNGRNLFMMK
jgi:hypothetical protein